MGLSVQTRRESDGAVVVAVHGEVEHDNADQISRAVSAAVTQYRPAMLYLDLGLVTFMATGGVGALVASHQSARSGGTRLVVRNPSPFVDRLLHVSGIGFLLR